MILHRVSIGGRAHSAPLPLPAHSGRLGANPCSINDSPAPAASHTAPPSPPSSFSLGISFDLAQIGSSSSLVCMYLFLFTVLVILSHPLQQLLKAAKYFFLFRQHSPAVIFNYYSTL